MDEKGQTITEKNENIWLQFDIKQISNHLLTPISPDLRKDHKIVMNKV